ncbi:hypothetical protein BJ322DRAFT_1010699 [Thelephora terrestris]|uniref:HMG domain-containing protein n=1 Tax=Thelephora terrestris TaxID=56493 RepID=A0A9P6H824_9AGAM|nr:hypothetical protein BJ322DRAFT_1010699 [Thelephora terrestris]
MDEKGTLDLELTVNTPLIESDKSSPVPLVKAPIFYLPIPSPHWCRLATDTLDYASPLSSIPPPSLLTFDSKSWCCCGSVRPEDVDTTTQSFVVFGVQTATRCEIEVAACMVCCHCLQKKYGPDCGSVGILNGNKCYGFTHELLNEYMSLFTSTVIPFSTFVTTHHRAYTDLLSPLPFCSTETFTRVWFAFTELQELDSGMQCISCGQHPETIIADGFSIAYSSLKFVQGLLPPSATSNASPVNNTATLGSSNTQKAIPDWNLWKKVQGLVALSSRPMDFALPSNAVPELYSLVSYYLHLPAKSKLCVAVHELLLQVCIFRC